VLMSVCLCKCVDQCVCVDLGVKEYFVCVDDVCLGIDVFLCVDVCWWLYMCVDKCVYLLVCVVCVNDVYVCVDVCWWVFVFCVCVCLC